MTRQTVWVAALAVSLLGCSDNKPAECLAIKEIVSSFKTQSALLGTLETQEAAAMNKASTAVKALRKKLDTAQLTDEGLLTFRIKAAPTFSAFGRLLDESEKTLTSVSQTSELRSGYSGLLKDARDALDAACDKKERKRKARRSKKHECKVIHTTIADISVDTAQPEALQNSADGLRNLAVKNKSVQEAVAAVADQLEKMKEVREVALGLKKKLKAHAEKFQQLSQELKKLETDLNAQCSDAS